MFEGVKGEEHERRSQKSCMKSHWSAFHWFFLTLCERWEEKEKERFSNSKPTNVCRKIVVASGVLSLFVPNIHEHGERKRTRKVSVYEIWLRCLWLVLCLLLCTTPSPNGSWKERKNASEYQTCSLLSQIRFHACCSFLSLEHFAENKVRGKELTSERQNHCMMVLPSFSLTRFIRLREKSERTLLELETDSLLYPNPLLLLLFFSFPSFPPRVKVEDERRKSQRWSQKWFVKSERGAFDWFLLVISNVNTCEISICERGERTLLEFQTSLLCYSKILLDSEVL